MWGVTSVLGGEPWGINVNIYLGTIATGKVISFIGTLFAFFFITRGLGGLLSIRRFLGVTLDFAWKGLLTSGMF